MTYTRAQMQQAMDDWLESVVWVDVPLAKGEHGWEADEHPRGKTTEESNEGSFTFKGRGYSSTQKQWLAEAKAKQKAFEKNGGQKGVRYDAKLEADAVTKEQARDLMYRMSGLEDVKAQQDGSPYQGPKTFVKLEGTFMRVPDEPPPIKLRTMKECFKNSTDFVMEHSKRYEYCEGYVFLPNLPIPIHHAWVWDNEKGHVIDPTLGWAPKAQYWGVKFSGEFLIANLVKQRYYGLLMQGDSPTDLVMGNDELYQYRMEGEG